MIYHSNSPKETRNIASNLASKTKSGIIALEGELGAGKTTFVQAFVRALGVKAKVKSPTFNLIKKYIVSKLAKSRRRLDFQGDALILYHIDCYRLKDHREAIPLGIKDIFEEKNAIVLIEWPERISKILPKKMIRIHIDHIGKDKRKIIITNN